METAVYVDVLLVLNYGINTLLLLCTAKIAGRSPKRRKIVAAAVLGSVSSLTIFLPFTGILLSVCMKLFISAAIIFTAFSWENAVQFCKLWFLFFAVNFFFAGAMLGVWMLFTPRGMVYYNGIVYFNISFGVLIAATVLAYLLLSLSGRITRDSRLAGGLYEVEVALRGRSAFLTGLIDSGNRLYEPFSDLPVMVCGAQDISPLLSPELLELVREGRYVSTEFANLGIPVRLIPYEGVGGEGILPALRPDRLVLSRTGQRFVVECAYVAIAPKAVGGKNYNAILSPDFIGMKLADGGVRR